MSVPTKRIDYMMVEIKPYMRGDNLREITVHIVVNNDQINYRNVVSVDDFESFFDQLWKHTGNKIREQLNPTPPLIP